jgi:hypothetical protein
MDFVVRLELGLTSVVTGRFVKTEANGGLV